MFASYQLIPEHLPQQFADLMLQTAMAGNQCQIPKETCKKPNIGAPIYFVSLILLLT